ncbi:MAG: hypothetical protein NTW07_10455, partial [candidate division Zixibacteria bacterium]|nr:hypothetical protein [candidate division Zixibacteria bacterium]
QGEVSFEDSQLEHGVFTYYLLKGLQGDADDQANGGNGDGTVTLYEAIKYTQANVKRFSHDRQNPAIAGTYDASIPLGVRK